MDMRELELLVPTLFGLEGLCAEELRSDCSGNFNFLYNR